MKFEDCIYKDFCMSVCKEACIRYVEMKFLLKTSNIPKSKQKINKLVPENCDNEAFEQLALIRESIVDFTQNGEQLYIYSNNCGNGKTTWAIKLMLQYFNEIWPGNGFTERGLFIHVPTYLYMCKQVISKPDENFEHLREMLPEVDLVIWDEIASTDLSNYDYTNLLVLLDQRSINERSNIFTGNIQPNSLERILGSKLSSRILYRTKKIELKGGDRRNGTTSNFE